MPSTRRRFLAISTTAAAGLAGCVDHTDRSSPTDDGSSAAYGDRWTQTTTNTAATFHGVATLRGTAVAVGADGSIYTRESAELWRHRSVSGVGRSALRAVAVTADGARAWIAGDDGTVLAYDVAADTFTSHDDPLGSAEGYVDVAVDGDAGAETVTLVEDSGDLVHGERDQNGFQWERRSDPGAGDTTNVAFTAGHGYLVTDSGQAFQRPATTWTKAGIDGVDARLTDVTGDGKKRFEVASAAGAIHRYDGVEWQTTTVDHSISALVRTDQFGLAVSEAGAIYAHDGGWKLATEVPTVLTDVSAGRDEIPTIVVGDGGTILERTA